MAPYARKRGFSRFVVSSLKFSKLPLIVGSACILALAALAVFSNTFRAPFVLDDQSTIEDNVSIRQLWPLESPTIGGTRGRPLANFSLAVNYRFGGLDVTGYHVLNLAIHVAAGLALFGLVRRSFLLPIFAEQFSAKAGWVVAFSAALLWLVHPLQTETVTYVVQRTESLMALHYLLTLYCFCRAVQSRDAHRQGWYVLAVLACFAGMAAKEVMITAPVAVLLYDRTFVAGGFKQAWRQRFPFYATLASSWVLLAWLMIGSGSRGIGTETGVGPWHYALTESCVLVQYFKLVFWPTPLVFDYGSEIATSLTQVWPCAALVMCGVIGVLVALRFKPVWGFLLAWPFLTLAPTSSFVAVALQPMAEHRMSLPLASLSVLAAVGLWRYLGGRALLAVSLLAAILGRVAYERNAVYADEVSLWGDTVAKKPANDRARLNFGAALIDAGRLPEAATELEQALAVNPKNVQAWSNLGLVRARTGHTDQALQLFETAVQIEPGFAEAHYNRGCVLLESGRGAESRPHFETAIRLNPLHGNAHINLAAIFSGEEKYDAARQHYTAALRIDPRDAQLYLHRAFAHVKTNRLGEAMADYEQALKLQPNLAEARRNLEILRHAAAPPPPPR